MFSEEELKWQEISREKKFDCFIFDYISVKKKSFDNKIADFTLLDSPDWVNVIAIVKNQFGEDSFLMVQQYRHGSDSITTEFPAGVVERGENPLFAAERELVEETGYKAEKFIELGNVNPNPAFMNNRVWTYLAINPKKISQQNLDENEIVNSCLIPVSEVIADMGKGKYDNGIMIIALNYYLKYKRGGDRI